MMWFRQRKPRRFEHRMIYADDRKKFLSELEQRAKGELGMSEKKTTALISMQHSLVRRRICAAKRRDRHIVSYSWELYYWH